LLGLEVANGRHDRPNAFLPGLGDKTDKHNPNQENAGDHPNEKIIMLINFLLFFSDNHIHSPFLKVCEKTLPEGPMWNKKQF